MAKNGPTAEPYRFTLRDLSHYFFEDLKTMNRCLGGSDEHFSLLQRVNIFLFPSSQCAFFHRIAHWLYVKRWKRLAFFVSRVNYILHRCEISPNSRIGPGVFIPHTVGVVFCGRAGARFGLFPRSYTGAGRLPVLTDEFLEHCPVIGDDAIVGVDVVLSGPVKVGDGSFVTTQVVYSRDVPPWTMVLRGTRDQVREAVGGNGRAAS